VAEVSSWQRCPRGRGVLVAEVSSWLRCPRGRGVLVAEVSSWQRCPRGRGVHSHFFIKIILQGSNRGTRTGGGLTGVTGQEGVKNIFFEFLV
jgi:hypothetical protein